MADDNIRLQISFRVDPTKELPDINKAIKELEKKVDSLKLKIEVPQDFQQSIQSFINATNKLKAISDEQNKVVEQTQEVFKKLDGTITTVTEKIKANGEIIKQTKIVHDENKKAMQDETIAAQKLAEVVDKQNKADLDSITILKNKAGAIKGFNVKSSQGYSATSTRLESDGQTLIGSTTNTNYKKQREDEIKAGEEVLQATRKNLLQEENEYADFTNKVKKQYDNLQASIRKNLLQEENDTKSFTDKAIKQYQDLINFQEKAQTKASSIISQYGSRADTAGISSLLGQANGLKPGDEAQMAKISNGFKDIEASARKAGMSITSQFGEAMSKFPIWIASATLIMGTIHGIKDAFQTMSDVDVKMAGYVQTNEDVLNSQQKIDAEAHKFIQTAHDLGTSIDDVLESARLFGRMYHDLATVQTLVNQSTQLSTIDLVSLGDATKGMESILSQYHITLNNVNDAQVIGNSLIDKFSRVAHESNIPAKDLVAAYERMGSAAYQTGVSIDFMNGLLASGFKSTALSGENLGNMWKTVLGNIRSDKAVKEIERLGVATKQVVDGTKQWRSAEDILLDLSVKVIGKNEDLTKSYEDIARGVYQYQKLAASLDLGNIIQGEASSLNIVNKDGIRATTEYLTTQMDTIQRKSQQVRASFVDLFVTAGDDGLRNAIKSTLDVVDQFLSGLSKVSTSGFAVVGTLGAVTTSAILLAKPISNLGTAIKVLSAAKVVDTAITTEETAAINAMTAAEARATVTTAIATAGVTLIVGALAALVFHAGSAAKAQEDLTTKHQNEISALEEQYGMYQKEIDTIPKWIDIYFQLTDAVNSGTLSVDGQSKAKTDLDKISKALAETIGQEGLAQIQSAKNADEATKAIIESLNKRKIAIQEAIQEQTNADISANSTKTSNAEQTISDAQKIIDKNKNINNPYAHAQIADAQKQIADANADLDSLKRESTTLAQQQVDATQELLKLNASSGKSADKGSIDPKKEFDQKMADFRHYVNMQEDGYKTAGEQADKLKAIKEQFQGKLTDSDLYSLDEEIYRADNDKPLKAKGFSSPKSPKQDTQASLHTPTDFTKEEIDAINEVIKSRDRDITSLEKQVKAAEKIKDYNKEIELTNQLLTEQEGKIKDINSANDQIKQRADDLRNTNSDLANQFASPDENGNMVGFEAWFTGKDASQTYIDTITEIDNKIKDIEGDGKNLTDQQKEDIKTQENKKSLYEDIFKQIQAYKEAWDANYNSIQTVADAVDQLSSNLDSYYNTLIDNAQKAKDAVDKINTEIISTQDEMRSQISSIADSVIQIYKDYYKARQQGIDDTIKKEQELYDFQVKSIDATYNAEQYKQKLTKLQDEQLGIQKQLNVSLLNNDTLNKKKREDLQKQLADKTTEIQQLVAEHDHETRKQTLQDSLDTQKKELNNQKDKYQQLIDDDSKYNEIRKQIMSGTFDAVLKDFNGFKDELTKNSDVIGKGLSTGVIDKITEMQKTLQKVSDIMGPLFATLGTTIQSDVIDKLEKLKAKLDDLNTTKTDKLQDELKAVKDLLDQINTLSMSWDKLSDIGKASAHDDVVRLRTQLDNEYGTKSTFDAPSGIWNVSKNGQLIGTTTDDQATSSLDAWYRDKTHLGNYNLNGDSQGNTQLQPTQGTLQGQSGYYQATTDDERNMINSMKANGAAWFKATAEQKAGLERNNQGIGAMIGATYNNGTWFKNGLPLYHNGGIVGTSDDPKAKALHKMFNLNDTEEMAKLLKGEVVINPNKFSITTVIGNLMSNLKLPSFNGINKNNTTPSSPINMTLNFNGFSGTKRDAEFVYDEIITGLNKMGVKYT